MCTSFRLELSEYMICTYWSIYCTFLFEKWFMICCWDLTNDDITSIYTCTMMYWAHFLPGEKLLIWFSYISFYCIRSNFLPSIQTTHFCLYKKDFVFQRLFYIYLLLFEGMSIMTSWSCLSFPTHVKQVVLTTSLGWFPISHIPSRARWGRGALSCVRSWPPC